MGKRPFLIHLCRTKMGERKAPILAQVNDSDGPIALAIIMYNRLSNKTARSRKYGHTMNTRHEEWLKQADYDIETAEIMFHSGRHFYAVFMCHMSVEKALKSLFVKQLGEVPPKTHNLLYLLSKIEVRPEQELEKFITRLNTASIATRYPEDLARLQAVYTAEITIGMIRQSKEVLQWIKQQL
jgi:HEPN domain-containing protein